MSDYPTLIRTRLKQLSVSVSGSEAARERPESQELTE